jgi:SNF family Na+-dependent transporter
VNQSIKKCPNLYITEEFFFKDLVKLYKDDCTAIDTSSVIIDESIFGSEVYLATLLTWIIVYFCMWKGVNSSSYVVWVTVPLPVLFIFIMVVNNLALPNASDGIKMYIKGYDLEGNPPNAMEKLSNGQMWSEACGQIFFSLGICMGSMTSYGSFNKKYKPIIGDSFQIAFINCGISFFAGFAVFSVVGYLNGIGSPVASKTASIGLAFIAYPAAIEEMPGSNGWSFILSVTLFTLGIDSAFSLMEAASTVMQDSPMFKEMPRKLIALILCVLGAFFSLFFSFNWGFTYFDVVDHFLNVYLMLLLGIMECFGAAWVYGVGQVLDQQETKVAPVTAGQVADQEKP